MINSRIGIIYDRKSGRIIWGKNENKKSAMASTTKIMTCIVVIENANLNDEIKISAKAAGTGGSRLGLKKDDKITIVSFKGEKHNCRFVNYNQKGDFQPFASRAECGRVFNVFCLLQKVSPPGMFSFGCKREPENNQRFQRAGSMKKGLLAPFRPQSS